MARNNPYMPPGQMAQRAVMNIFVRLAGCGLLVYFIYGLVVAEEFSEWKTWQIIVVGFMSLFSVVMITLTIIELVKNIKSGAYTQAYYINLYEKNGIVVDGMYPPEDEDVPEDDEIAALSGETDDIESDDLGLDKSEPAGGESDELDNSDGGPSEDD